jgi:signal transduction histidine kinase
MGVVPLARFIRENIDAILDEWQAFAASIPSAAALDRTALRNDAQEILMTIALDMDQAQSSREQSEKAKGRPPRISSADTAAETHAGDRFASGFDLKEMVSEYRALRASVIRLWSASGAHLDPESLYQLTRFNEGIDQALTESIARFSDRIDESRQLFMGVLGHDLRTPLQIILQSTESLSRLEPEPDQSKRAVGLIRSSTQNIAQMIDDLLDVTRTRFGASLPVRLQRVDARSICDAAVMELKALHPNRQIHIKTEGDLAGMWDAERLHQLLSNLLRNAIQHGDPKTPVTIVARGEKESVEFKVHNFGAPIPPSLLPHIFEPLQRGFSNTDVHFGSLGLGLYIACIVARAHQGTIDVESSAELGTTFTACLPREPR